jgi:hypothetical protein
MRDETGPPGRVGRSQIEAPSRRVGAAQLGARQVPSLEIETPETIEKAGSACRSHFATA